MNRRLKKLIEEKAWETLTEHGYNDSQLFEQLKKKVVNLFSEQFEGGGDPGSINALNGMVFYFPFSFSTGFQFEGDTATTTFFAGGYVLGADAFNELGLQEINRQFDEHYNNGGSPENFQPDWSAPGFEYGMNWDAAQIVVSSAPFSVNTATGEILSGPQNAQEAQELAVLRLMQRIASMSPGAIVASGVEGYTSRETRESRRNRDTPLLKFFKQISRRIRELLEARGYNDADARINGGQGLIIRRFGDQPFFPGGVDGPGISGKGLVPRDFRASRGGLGGGLGGPGGGRMAPPSQPPQQRMPRMPGRGFGGGQGMPTPGFAPPTPPVQ